MTKIEKVAEGFGEAKHRWKALMYAADSCPSDCGMKNKYNCLQEDGTMKFNDCVDCWLEEYKDDEN